MNPDLPMRLLMTRRKLKKTQRMVADDIGVTKLTIMRIENAHHAPKPSTARLIETWIELNQPREEIQL